jgi:hypothetical protein
LVPVTQKIQVRAAGGGHRVDWPPPAGFLRADALMRPRSSRSARCAHAWLLALALALAGPSALAGAPYAGRPVQDALAELAGGRLNFIYNTDLVPAGLLVQAEPAAGAPLDVAREILAAHGLALSAVGGDAWAIVRAEGAGGATGSVTGRVRDAGGAPVAGARVALEGGAPATASGANGAFRLEGVPPGRHRLVVTAPGFLPGAANGVRVRARRAAEVNVTLAAESPDLAEMVVTTSRYALGYSETQASAFLTHADVQAQPKLADEPLRVVQRLPGSASTGITALTHLRGGEHDEVLLVLDGLPLYEPFHLKDFLAPVSVFDARAIESMEVSSGGFTANFGDRMSGVVDITSLEPPEERYTELGFSLFHASALSAVTFGEGRGQWLGSVRRSNLDWLSQLAENDVGKPEYFDAFARVSYDLTDATTLFGNALTSRDEIRANSSSGDERVDAEYRNTYGWGGWRQRWPSGFASSLVLAFTDVDNNRDGAIDQPGLRSGAVDERRTLRTGTGRLDVTHEGGRFFTRFGAEGREVKARYRYRSTSTFEPGYPYPGAPGGTVTRDLAPEPDGHQFGAYVTTRARVTGRLTTELGIRWDDQTWDDVDGPEQYSPRLNLMYDLTDATRLRFAWGRFWQAQGPNELQVEDGVDHFREPQRADHLILGLEQSLPREIDLRIELYQKDYDRPRPHFENLFDPVQLLPELEPDRVEVAPTRGRARGVELSLARQDGGPWSWWFSYAWARVTDRIDGADVPRSWDQTHTLNAGLRYAGELWEFTAANTWHSGWPTTALFIGDDGLGNDAVVVGERNADDFGSYNSLDLRVLRRFELPDSTLEAFLEVTGALAQGNECCTEYTVYDLGGGELALDRDVDEWPRIIPSIGVLWRF